MKKVLCIIYLALLAFPMSAQRVLSLDSCRALAIANNKELLISQEKINAAHYQKKAAFTNYLPKLSATGGYMDIQAQKLRQELVGTGVQVAELDNNQVQLIMPSNILFDFDSSVFKTNFNQTLDSVSKVLKEYDKTHIIIAGYTDNIGSESYNNKLSLKRAQAVSDYLVLRGISPARISVYGYGSQYPIASNNTEAGRSQNRRVTITLQQI